MLLELDIPNPLVNISDRQKALLAAHTRIWPEIPALLCVWHINKDVVANCKGKFTTKEDWNEFYAAWITIVYAHTREDFENK